MDADGQLASLVEEITQKLEAGEQIDLTDYAHENAEHAEQLRRLMPALQALVLAGQADNGKSDRDAKRAADIPVSFRQLGDFRILRELGRGGMGVVYEADQLSMGRRVALKVLPFAALVQDNSLQRFRNEVRAAAALDHPNIVSIYSVGEERGVHYYAMQLIRGQSLASVITQLRQDYGNPSPEESPASQDLSANGNGQATNGHAANASTIEAAALSSTKRHEHAHISTFRHAAEFYRSAARLGIQAADALDHAHQNGILHRDIKPANLLVDDTGKLWVTDFGLARMEADAGVTMTGDLLGTLRYMSPEQALAKRVVIDHRSDIYSLGATLYELLTLQPAFAETDRAKLLQQIALEEPRPLRKIDGQIPAELETIVLKAMAKQREERYQTSELFADDLRAFLESRPIKAKPPRLTQRAAKWSRRHQSLVSTMAIGFVLLSAVLAISMVKVHGAKTQALVALGETADLLYTTDMTLAYQTFEKGWTGEVQMLLDRHRPIGGGPDRRGFEWHLLQKLVEQPSLATLAATDVPVHELAVFPDRRRLASVSNDGTLGIWDVRARKLARRIRICDEPLHSVAISPDGRYVAVGSTAVYLWDLAQGDQATELFRGEHIVESLAFTTDGNRLVLGTHYDEVCLITRDGHVVKCISCPSRNESLEFAHGGRLLLLTNRRLTADQKNIGVAQLWREDLSNMEREFDRTGRRVRGNLAVARASPCGNFVAAGEERQSRATLFDVNTGKIVGTTPVSRDWLRDLSFSPDGKAIAVGYRNGQVEIFTIRTDRDGTPFFEDSSRVLSSHQGKVSSVRFVDAATLATCGTDGLVRIWDLSRDAARTFDLANIDMNSMALSPHGDMLLYVGESEFLIVDTESGNVVFRRHNPGESFYRAGWSPTGDKAAVVSFSTESVIVLNPAGQSICKIPHVGRINELAFSPTGSRIAIIGEDFLQIANSEDGRSVYQRPLDTFGNAIAFSHDGERIAYGGNGGRICLFDATRLQPLYELPCASDVHCLAFSPNDSILVSGHGDTTIRTWELETRRMRGELSGHEREVQCVAFSPDGRALLSTARDGTARLWSFDHHRAFGVIHRRAAREGAIGANYALSLSADGQSLAIGYELAKQGPPDVLLWRIDPSPSN